MTLDCRLLATQLADRDLKAKRREYAFSLPSRFQKWLSNTLEDPRDLPAALLLANISLSIVPAALFMYAKCTSHVTGLAYLLVNYAWYIQRYMLTLHFTEHRRLFKQEYNWLNYCSPFFLCTLYGVPSGLYRPHHVIMHHIEDNHSPLDWSSTEPYQRDQLIPFLWYWTRHWLGGWFALPTYAFRKQRLDWATSTLSSEFSYLAAVTLLWRLNHVATLWCFIIPYMLTSFLAMLGNWSQHVFVNPKAPGAFGVAYNCIDSADNSITYNDGYHIIHHHNSRVHWSELPSTFIRMLEEHDRHDALVFRKLGFFDVGLNVFLGRLGFLADHIVPCGPRQAQRTKEEWVEVLRERLKPIKRDNAKRS
mmetsp:Transcript_39615/g.88092  ORF Transcript_39615/g.88092 Transcript_39615/m.88092 type:complete len:363 (-) Transcript_39615:628-1716(-)